MIQILLLNRFMLYILVLCLISINSVVISLQGKEMCICVEYFFSGMIIFVLVTAKFEPKPWSRGRFRDASE